MSVEMVLIFRSLLPTDPEAIEEAFARQGWHKPAEQYRSYLREQVQGDRDIIIAVLDGNFAGYVTVLYSSQYPPFRDRGVPEISDLNVLMQYQRCGIGAALVLQAEKLISQTASCAGIGVGLLKDYGSAQKLYIKLGYCPDGLGITYKYQPIIHGASVTADDDLVLWLTKQLA